MMTRITLIPNGGEDYPASSGDATFTTLKRTFPRPFKMHVLPEDKLRSKPTATRTLKVCLSAPLFLDRVPPSP